MSLFIHLGPAWDHIKHLKQLLPERVTLSTTQKVVVLSVAVSIGLIGLAHSMKRKKQIAHPTKYKRQLNRRVRPTGLRSPNGGQQIFPSGKRHRQCSRCSRHVGRDVGCRSPTSVCDLEVVLKQWLTTLMKLLESKSCFWDKTTDSFKNKIKKEKTWKEVWIFLKRFPRRDKNEEHKKGYKNFLPSKNAPFGTPADTIVRYRNPIPAQHRTGFAGACENALRRRLCAL
ncbi:hypothetical protein FQR65_LT02267 [Abscondita terminalis]|nr:hypothetical protein FQR65_LT02267 [Abscondita terminalis]